MKIGILTIYYNNFNYGGQLQAYALTTFLNNMGFDAEQIAYNRIKQKFLKNLIINIVGVNTIRKVKKIFLHQSSASIDGNCTDKHIVDMILKRNMCIKQFEKFIPHSKKTYNYKNIHTCNKKYNTFIVGSDQVWNVEWFTPAYFLNFVESDKKKISYAASMPQTTISTEKEAFFKNTLKDFSAISVRENITVDFLHKLLNKEIVQVLDPTLLLNKEDWDKICSERIINEKYVFCYFLGAGKEKRKLAEAYAKKEGLKLVTLPYLLTDHRDDEDFGDYKLYEITPNDFLSLIKNAEFVFTDSFHAAVFSSIFEKEFCVIDRNKAQGYMLSRIHTLLNMLGEADRLIPEDKCFLETIYNFKKINYTNVKNIISKEQEKSKNFLISNL